MYEIIIELDEHKIMKEGKYQLAENYMLAAMKDIPFEEKVQIIYENNIEEYINK